jgi:hypothetical protein
MVCVDRGTKEIMRREEQYMPEHKEIAFCLSGTVAILLWVLILAGVI